MDLPSAIRVQAAACLDLGSPMYAYLLDRAADDAEAGGPVAAVLAGHEDDPGPSALALRLLGSVHRLVLEHRAAHLARFYPSVGGHWQPDGGWRALRQLLAERPDEVREWLDRPPQTNEVGRSTALYGGLLHLPRGLPVRLFEIGASAGLNLLADRFAYFDQDGNRFGSDADDLVLTGAWKGRRLVPWPELRIVERLGCDPMPVDPSTAEGRLVLAAYVWPDQPERLERLRAALRLAPQVPVPVRRQHARRFVEGLALEDGTTTVLWHSVMWQYLSADEQAEVSQRIEQIGDRAGQGRRFAHLRAEPSRREPGGPHEFLVWQRTWPGAHERLLGATVAHGVPTTWE